MTRAVAVLMFLAACATPEPATPDVVALFEQAPLPGKLSLDAPAMYAGEPVTLSVSGADPGEMVYFGLSTAGVVQRSVCPPILQDCLNLATPVSLLGQAAADRAGRASILIDVPNNALYSSIFLQAAAFSGVSTVAHRFVEPPDSDCGVGIAPPRCLPEVIREGAWTCGAGVSCQDVYDISLTAGTEVTLDVDQVVGASVVRLAVFEPGVALGGTNLLTNTNRDSECTGQNQPASATFTAAVDGVYRVAVGRDWGSSAGASGGYRLRMGADPGLEDLGLTVNDGASAAAGTVCGFVRTQAGEWTCGAGVSCQDVYDLPVVAGDRLTFSVGSVTGASVPRLGLYPPAAPLTGTNALTGTTADRECVGQNATDTTATWVVPTTGTWRLTVGRDWGSSAGGSGTYLLTVTGEEPFGALTQTSNNVASGQTATQCDFTWRRTLGWTCPAGVSCQDVFDVPLEPGADLQVNHTGLTQASVSRLAVFAPGTPLSGTNVLTGTNLDQECVGQNQSQSTDVINANPAGTWRVAVGRDWGSSAGVTGTYTVEIVVDGSFPSITQTAEDAASQAGGSTCPP